MTILGLLLTWIAIRAWHSIATPVPTDRDIPYLAHVLESAHPNLYFHESRSTFLRLAQVAQADLHDHPEGDPYDTIASFVSSIGDAHTYISPYNDPYVRMRDAGGRLFPFEVYRRGDAIVIDRFYGTHAAYSNGTQLVSVNRRPILQLWSEVGRNVSAERSPLRDHFISDDIRPLLWHAGVHAPFRITFRAPNGTVFTDVLAGCTVNDIATWDYTPEGKVIDAPLSYSFDAPLRIALVRVHSFSVEDDQGASFLRKLSSIKSDLRRDRPQDLLIDVRYNDGGSSVLSDALTNVFASHPYRDFASGDVKSNVFMKNRLGHDDYVDLYGDDAWNASEGTVVHQLYNERTVPPPNGSRYRGRTYILVGSGTFSIAATFAAAAQDANNAVIMGRESGGLATYFGESYLFSLPYSGFDMSVGTKYLVRGNGNVAPRGVLPSIALEETPEGLADPELRAAFRAMINRR